MSTQNGRKEFMKFDGIFNEIKELTDEGRYEKALANVMLAFKLTEDPFLTGRLHGQEANLYKCQEQFDKAIVTHNKCLQSWQQCEKAEKMIPVAYYNMVNVQRARADAEQNADAALKIRQGVVTLIEYALKHSGVDQTKDLRGLLNSKLALTHVELGNLDQAEEVFDQAKQQLAGSKNLQTETETYNEAVTVAKKMESPVKF